MIVLASASPRRAALLREAGIPFEVGAPPDVDETPPPGLAADQVARALAERKARVAVLRAPGRWVLAADTIVALDGRLLGKPRDAADAAGMLRSLSGRTHEVVTGVALARDEHLESAVESARVTFRRLSDTEIAAYVATTEPMDKAGAYAIQGGAAGFVERLEGDVTTVVGLPVPLVRRMYRTCASRPS